MGNRGHILHPLKGKAILTFLWICLFLLSLGLRSSCEPLPEIPFKSSPNINLDGVPDEPVWKEAFKIESFSEGDTGQEIPYKTVFLLISSEKGLYWAGICYQPRETIVAQQKTNESAFHVDDTVALYIDPYGDGIGNLTFIINPLGTHSSYSSWDTTWFPIWRSKAKIFKDRWTFEAFIPFSVLRIPSGKERVIGLNARRHVSFLGGSFFWNTVGDYTNPMNFYKVIIQVPKPLRKLTILPQVYSFAKDNEYTHGLSLDLIYSQRSYSLELTLNPTFFESVIRQRYIRPTYVPRTFTETRPFFRRRMRYFVPFQPVAGDSYSLFYTYSIGDVDYGLKLTGQFGDLQGGLLSVKTKDHSTINVIRLLKSEGKGWKYGLFYGGDVLALDLGYVGGDSSKDIQLSSQVAFNGKERAGFVSYQYDDGIANIYSFGYTFISDDFNTELGYIPYQGATSLAFNYTRYFDFTNQKNEKVSIYTKLSFETTDIRKGNEFIGPGKISHLTLSHVYMNNYYSISAEVTKSLYEFGDRKEALSYSLGYERDFLHKKGGVAFSYSRDKFLGEDDYQYISAHLFSYLSKDILLLLGYSEFYDLTSRDKLSEISVRLIFSSKESKTRLMLYIDEKGNSNLVIRYRRLYKNGDELYLGFGNPQLLHTEPILFMKYIKKFRIEL